MVSKLPRRVGDVIDFDCGSIISGDKPNKCRALRSNGVDESYITGDKSNGEKFRKWAETVPCMLRNPLYHWTHLELQRYFNIHEVLEGKSADIIYDQC